jgi:hypothetical protein
MVLNTPLLWDNFVNPDGSCSIEVVTPGEFQGIVIANLPTHPARTEEMLHADGRLFTAAPYLLHAAMSYLIQAGVDLKTPSTNKSLEPLRHAVALAITGKGGWRWDL